jgi:hypothetical protein
MNNGKTKAKANPVKTIRQGAIAASIWKRTAPSGFEYFDFSVSRSWKSQNGAREGYSPNFFSNNRDDLVLVIQGAACWIVDQEAGLLAGDADTMPVMDESMTA